jgi:flavin reductase (DIM6/NTAB) family NADH-FMN oxidoreductase RutF
MSAAKLRCGFRNGFTTIQSSGDMSGKQIITSKDIQTWDKHFRTKFIQTLPGFKPLLLIGTMGNNLVPNLAPFSNVVHIGSEPPLLGIVFRPDSVSRHTLENIRSTAYFSLNSVDEAHIAQAHQCSARYDADQSEFEETGLTVQWYGDFQGVPFVQESAIHIFMRLEEEIAIRSNGTHLIIGRIEKVAMPQEWIKKDGGIDHFNAGTIVSLGLDTYAQAIDRAVFPYAKVPGQRIFVENNVQ